MHMSLQRTLILFVFLGACAAPPPNDHARVLILTGVDGHHDWRSTTPVLRTMLEEDPRVQVDVLDDLTHLATTDLAPYSAVVVHFKNDDPELPGRAAFDHLSHYVEGGGGMVLVHFACGAFQEFRDDWEQLTGRVWFGDPPPAGRRHHDPYGEFEVRFVEQAPAYASEVAGSRIAMTRGLEAFSTRDELYTCLTGDTPVHVVAEAVSKLDGQLYPMAMVRTPSAGRVFTCTLGHDVAALSTPEVGELYRRATAWASRMTPIPPPAPTRSR